MEEPIRPEDVEIGDHVTGYASDGHHRTSGEVVGRTQTGYLIVLGEGQTGDVKRRPYRAHRWVRTQHADPLRRDVRAAMTRAAQALVRLADAPEVAGFPVSDALNVLQNALRDIGCAAEDADRQLASAVERDLADADRRLAELEAH